MLGSHASNSDELRKSIGTHLSVAVLIAFHILNLDDGMNHILKLCNLTNKG